MRWFPHTLGVDLPVSKPWEKAAISGGLYFAFMGGGALLGIVKYGIFAKLLDPQSFGIYSLVLTTYVYIIYAGGLGLNEALIKLGAEAHGRDQFDQIIQMRDVALLYGGLTTLLCGLLFILGLKMFVADQALANSLSLAAILAVAALEFNLLDAAFRAGQKILFFSAMLFLKAFAVVVLGMYLAPKFGVNGVIAGEIIASVGVFLAFLNTRGSGFRASSISGSRAVFAKAVRNGFPLVTSMFLRNISMSLDRWVMAAAIGLLALGKYTFAMVIYLVALTGIGFLTNILGPRWLSEFGQGQDINRLFVRIKRTALIVGILAALFMGPFFAVLRIVIYDYYPAYAGADTLVAMALIYVGVAILVCTYLFDWLFVASSTESVLLRISVATLGLTACLVYAAYTLKAGIVFYAGVFLLCRIFTVVLYAQSVLQVLAGRLNLDDSRSR